MKPRIFISTVSSELKSIRQLTANVLARLGYEPVWQDIFGTESGDLKRMLREKIDGCQGLIQIVGRAYGAEPRDPDPEFGRVSYTQYELLYARRKRRWKEKKTWVLFAQDGCKRDLPVDELDLPADPNWPDPAGYQAERRRLQDAWRKSLREEGHIFHEAADDNSLQLKLERIKDEFAELRIGFRRRQNLVAGLSMVTVLLLCCTLGVLWLRLPKPWPLPTTPDPSTLVLDLKGFSGPIQGMAFHPREPWLAVIGKEKVARIWNYETGLQVAAVWSYPLTPGPLGQQTCVAFDPDGSSLLVGVQGPFAEQGSLRVYDVGKLTQPQSYGGENPQFSLTFPVFSKSAIHRIAFSAPTKDGKTYVALCGPDHQIELLRWKRERSERITGSMTASQLRTGNIVRYVGFLTPPGSSELFLAWSDNSDNGWNHLYSLSKQRIIEPAELPKSLMQPSDSLMNIFLTMYQGSVLKAERQGHWPGRPHRTWAEYSPDTNPPLVLVWGNWDGEGNESPWVGVWRLPGMSRLCINARPHRAPVTAGVVRQDAQVVATGDASGEVQVWDLTSGRTRRVFSSRAAAIDGIKFLRSRGSLAITWTPRDDRVDPDIGAKPQRFVSELVFSPFGVKRSTEVFRDLEPRDDDVAEPIHMSRDSMGVVTLEGPAPKSPHDKRFSHSYNDPRDYASDHFTAHRVNAGFANPLFVGKSQGAIECLDPVNLASGGMLSQRVLLGHRGPITDIIESPWAPSLASASLDGTVRFWEFEDGNPTGWPDLDVTPDGTVLAVRDKDLIAAEVRPGDRWISMNNVSFSTLLDDCLSGRWRFEQHDTVPCVFERAGGGIASCTVTLTASNAAYRGPFFSVLIIPPKEPQGEPDWVAWRADGTYAASEGAEAYVFRVPKEDPFRPTRPEPARSPDQRRRADNIAVINETAVHVLDTGPSKRP